MTIDIRSAVLGLTFQLLGCSFLPAPIPMTSQAYSLSVKTNPQCLFVLLPGAGDRGDEFQKQGFLQAIENSQASVHIITADATMGYYYKGIVAQRIEQDIIAPVRANTSAHIWIMGISMGGFGALHYAQLYPDKIHGVVIFAPYLGSESIGKEIKSAGGLAKWKADLPAVVRENNYQRQLWSWLHRVVTAQQPGPSLFLGFGDSDSLGKQASVLAEALPTQRVFHAAGAHEWTAWRDLLQQFLNTEEFKRDCGVP